MARDLLLPRKTRISGVERRKRILDAAAELFAAKGYHEASVGEIAEAAGISKVVVYDHFASKEGLFIELTKSARDELIGRGRAAMQATDSLEHRLRAAFGAFFAYVEEQPARARVLLLIPKGAPELQEAVTAIQEEATRTLAKFLIAEKGLLRGERHREERLVLIMEFLKIGLHGLAEWWVRYPNIPRDRLTATVMDVAWGGLKSRIRS